MRLSGLLSALACASLTLAVPSRRSNHVLHEKRAAEPRDWVRTRKLESHKVLPMRFGLTQQNLHHIEDLLMEVSHPESDSYGQHYSANNIIDLFAPSHATITAVAEWLEEAGIVRDRLRLSADKGWLEVNATVAEVEDLIKADYHVYTHPETGLEQISCHSYSVPEHVREHVDIIKPTVHFGHRLPAPIANSRDAIAKRRLGLPSAIHGPKTQGKRPAMSKTDDLSTCDEFITPDCLRALYNIKPEHAPVATHKNSYGIVEFTPQAFLAPDLDLFFRNFSPSLVGVRPKNVLIDGAVVQTTNQSFDFNGESDLDLEYAMALTNPQPITLLQTGDLVEGAGFDNWLDAVDKSFCTFEGGDDPTQDGIYPDPLPGGFKGPESCGIIKPPFVVSVSYGQDEGTVTQKFANRQCTEFGKLGLMGTTVLYSSGDFGVAGFGGECLNSSNIDADDGTRFNPDWPASCGFVTAVGATQILPGKTVKDPESACETVIFSGGGFSDLIPLPSYQENAVHSFLKNHPPPFSAAQFNNSGKSRAFPDISANGANYVIGIDGEFELVFGTSASSPVVGSMITLINDARLAIGKGPVGFINPVLYNPLFQFAFNDITIGGNQGCGTPGFTATKGWDPVTGVGTPNFELLRGVFLLLP